MTSLPSTTSKKQHKSGGHAESGAGDGWITASNNKKKSNKGLSASAAKAKSQQPTKKSPLEGNKFFLPKGPEAKLHKPAQPKTLVGGKKENEAKPEASFLTIMGLSADVADNKNNSKSSMDLAKVRGARAMTRAKQRFSKHSSVSLVSVPTAQTRPSPQVAPQASDEDGFVAVRHSGNKKRRVAQTEYNILLDLPVDVLSRGILSFLEAKDLSLLGSCSTRSKKVADEGFLWKRCLAKDYPESKITPVADGEWKLAYQVVSSNLDIRMRCSHTKQTFLEDVVGLGVDYTVNPRTRMVDYIAVSQDLIGQTAFEKHNVRSDAFGNKFKLFLPLYFSQEHFQRALPLIQETIATLWKRAPKPKPAATGGLDVRPFGCAPGSRPKQKEEKKKVSDFKPNMVLDVIPKIVTTFVVLLSDEGTSACQKSFEGFTRIHRLFLALAKEYPSIQREAVKRLARFVSGEANRSKKTCPNLGAILPLLMIVDQKEFQWAKIRSAYLSETFDRSVLWACKKYPQLDKITKKGVESTEKGHERVALTRDAMTVPLRLTMFHVYFLKAACQGNVSQRCNRYDIQFFQPPKENAKGAKDLFIAGPSAGEQAGAGNDGEVSKPQHRANEPALLSFEHFRDQVNALYTTTTWQGFFQFVGVASPKTKDDMAKLLRSHVLNSRRRKYHKEGMDFSKVHASGTSKILAKGQQYSASADLKRVVFEDHWTFAGGTKYLDATCLLYEGNKRVRTVDYTQRSAGGGSVRHSGDVMRAQGGTHTIHIELCRLPEKITTCVFVISAWSSATLKDIKSASVAFRNADAPAEEEPLCVYELDAHDKVAHLKSVIMCKLYRTPDGGWHVLAIGDSNRGSASNYGPIYTAVQGLV